MSGPPLRPAAGHRWPGSGAVLITGASGFVGSSLARRLSGAGRRVRCLVRADSDTRALADLPVETALGALGDPASLRRAADGVSYVVHCAAMVSDWGTVAEIRAANVAGTRNVLDAATTAGAQRLVHISTTDVYGHPGGGPLGEDARPAGFANWYAQTKLEAEGEVRRAARAGPLETVVLRPATVYGPGSKDLVGEIAAAIRGRHMLLVDRGRVDAGLLYVENLLDAVQLTLDHPRARGETFNLSDELDVSWARFTSDLAAGLGAPPVRLSLPYAVAFALGLSLESAYRLARSLTGLRLAPLLSRQAVQVLGRNQRFSARRVRERLGWEPRVGYREGMQATLDWLQARPPPSRGSRLGKDARAAGV